MYLANHNDLLYINSNDDNNNQRKIALKRNHFQSLSNENPKTKLKVIDYLRMPKSFMANVIILSFVL